MDWNLFYFRAHATIYNKGLSKEGTVHFDFPNLGSLKGSRQKILISIEVTNLDQKDIIG